MVNDKLVNPESTAVAAGPARATLLCPTNRVDVANSVLYSSCFPVRGVPKMLEVIPVQELGADIV